MARPSARDGVHDAGKKRKKGKKGKTKPTATSPPVSANDSTGSADPGPRCPQPAAPHFCASARIRVPACPSGKVFDTASGSCLCPQVETCCSSVRTSDSAILCFTGVANRGACANRCADAVATNIKFAGGSGRGARCASDQNACEVTCEADSFRGTSNECQARALPPRCRGVPEAVHRGPSRCTSDFTFAESACGCTSHQACADLLGPGAFCADNTGCTTGCSASTECVKGL